MMSVVILIILLCIFQVFPLLIICSVLVGISLSYSYIIIIIYYLYFCKIKCNI